MHPTGPPDDWTPFTLDDLFELSNGVNAEKAAYGRGVPFANVFEVIGNEALTDDKIPGRISLPPKALGRYRVSHGDVLFNRTSETPEEVGLSSVYTGSAPIVFGGFVFRGRPKTNRLSSDYARYALRSTAVRRQIVARGQGAIRSNISQRDLKSVNIVLPAVDEQETIAGVLSACDDLIASLARLAAKKQAIAEGIAQQLLTGRTRLPGFSATWTERTLAECGFFFKGRGIKRDDVQAMGVACIRYGELYTSFNYYVSTPISFVSPAVARTAMPLQTNDVLFASSGETRQDIGKCVAFIGEHPAVAGGDIVVFRPRGADAVYLASLMNSPPIIEQKSRLGQGDAVVHISARALGSIRATFPPMDEQHAIARVLRDADAEIAALNLRLDKAKAIKQGMAQRLLTGEIRLQVPEAAV